MIKNCSDTMPMDDLETLGSWIASCYSLEIISDRLINDPDHCVTRCADDYILYRNSESIWGHEIIISFKNPRTGWIDKYYPSIDEFIDLMNYIRMREIKFRPEKRGQINQSFSRLLLFFDKSVISTPSDI